MAVIHCKYTNNTQYTYLPYNFILFIFCNLANVLSSVEKENYPPFLSGFIIMVLLYVAK